MIARPGISRFAGLAAGILGAVTLAAQAQDDGEDGGGARRFELTPFVGARFSGQFNEQDGDGRFKIDDSSAQGIVFDVGARSGGQWEALYARQSTKVRTQSLLSTTPKLDLDIQYLQFGGTYLFDGIERQPYIAFSVGVSHFEPDPSTLEAETYPAASFGGGVQLRKGSRIGVRLEGRAYATFVKSSSDLFCNTSQVSNTCVIRLDGSTLWQWETSAGVVFRF